MTWKKNTYNCLPLKKQRIDIVKYIMLQFQGSAKFIPKVSSMKLIFYSAYWLQCQITYYICCYTFFVHCVFADGSLRSALKNCGILQLPRTHCDGRKMRNCRRWREQQKHCHLCENLFSQRVSISWQQQRAVFCALHAKCAARATKIKTSFRSGA